MSNARPALAVCLDRSKGPCWDVHFPFKACRSWSSAFRVTPTRPTPTSIPQDMDFWALLRSVEAYLEGSKSCEWRFWHATCPNSTWRWGLRCWFGAGRLSACTGKGHWCQFDPNILYHFCIHCIVHSCNWWLFLKREEWVERSDSCKSFACSNYLRETAGVRNVLESKLDGLFQGTGLHVHFTMTKHGAFMVDVQCFPVPKIREMLSASRSSSICCPRINRIWDRFISWWTNADSNQLLTSCCRVGFKVASSIS